MLGIGFRIMVPAVTTQETPTLKRACILKPPKPTGIRQYNIDIEIY